MTYIPESVLEAAKLTKQFNQLQDFLMEPPIRLCCGQRHIGSVCSDDKVMCCLCFSRVSIEDLNVLENGKKEDVCKKCAEKEELGG